jgi:Bacterial SH3 domain
MSNKHVSTLSVDVPTKRCEPQIAPQIGAAGISGALTTPEGITVGSLPRLVVFGITVGLVALVGIGSLLVTRSWDEMLATRSETAIATAIIPPMQTDAAAAAATPPVQTDIGAAGATPPMQTDIGATGATPPMQTDIGATGATPPMQTDIGATGATPPMQTDAAAAAATPPTQIETAREVTPIPRVQAFLAFEAALSDLASPVRGASPPGSRPFDAKIANGRARRHVQPAADQRITFEPYRDAVAAAARQADVGRVITRQGANVRDAPTGFNVLRNMPRGTVLRVFARHGGWVQVGEEVPMGWVYSSLLTDAP